MIKEKFAKKMTFLILIIILFLCSYSPNYVAEEELPEIKLELNLPLIHNFHGQHRVKISNSFERSGWPQIYDKGIEETSSAITIDSQDNIIVTGYTGYIIENSTEVLDFLTIKYDSEGNELWNVTFDSGTYDYAWDIAVDSFDNIIVFGFNWTTDDDLEDLDIYFRIIKYNKNGIEQWNLTIHKGIDNYPGGITVDSNDCIIICGGYGDIEAVDFSCWTSKMDSEGLELWNHTFNQDLLNIGSDVAVDSKDDILVGGMSASFFGQGYSVIRYDNNGNKISVHRYNQGSQPNAITVDNDDNIILTGVSFSRDTNSSTWYTIKCNKAGYLLWAREYDSGKHDVGDDVSVDSNGNIVTVGGCFSGNINYEHCAIIYYKNGKELCLKRPNVYGFINGVAIDSNDRIVITGSISFTNNWDIYTNIYVDVTPPSVKLIKPEVKSFYFLNTKLFSLPRNTFIIGKITISLSSENPSDVQKVEFYVDYKLRKTLSTPPYEWRWSERLFGRYHIKTMAYDESGSVAKYEHIVWKFF